MSSIIKVDTVQDQDGNNIINENANTITIGASGDTITIPSGATLANNGTATGFASIAWQSSIVTAATITVESGKGYWLDTSSNAITVTLPAAPSVGDQIILTDYARNWGTNAVTINQNSLNFQGNTTPQPVYNTNGESIDIVYSGATKGWIPNTDGAVALETPQFYSADFLVIAGGGSGSLGGGGAGGYRTSTQNLTPGATYTITVGDGGASLTGSEFRTLRGNNGSNSLISGTGITTITSAGGGGGGARVDSTLNTGADGGSGGGAGADAAGSGTNYAGGISSPVTSPVQGYEGGTGQHTGGVSTAAGGGGGASANGTNGSGNTRGNGGAGAASSITGSSVTRGGGGGGGAGNAGGTGGTGGGGAGVATGTATNGTVNTGGGGGGTESEPSPNTTGAGGSGVVILSVPDASYSGTTTGSPTVATGVSGQTVLTFTGDGSYTA